MEISKNPEVTQAPSVMASPMQYSASPRAGLLRKHCCHATFLPEEGFFVAALSHKIPAKTKIVCTSTGAKGALAESVVRWTDYRSGRPEQA